ncbi:TIGR03086 family metal-binding protein [Nocardioides sp.]|uniref:TIGR03086 family metal-binding protein n=1 Tax=Nocardioides sp. TaxID=35761 RepID=UPI0027280750|nr:TIGR03086 family metal-binding protein [Nocardioides sp.]MDO9457874.1 TIGR03086 family metal-binding protein [Nocardioides sp.]
MTTLDFTPSTRALAELVRSVGDDDLTRATPCPAYTVADLVDHVGGLTLAFTAAATKTPLGDGGDPSGDGSRLEPEFRDRIATGLAGLAEAWADPAAYDGMTQAGPVELPAEVAAMVALNEVVVHAWDLAVSLGRPYDGDPAAVAVCQSFVASFEPPADGPAGDDGPGLFGPPVAPAPDASEVDRLVAAAGRRPDWPAAD